MMSNKKVFCKYVPIYIDKDTSEETLTEYILNAADILIEVAISDVSKPVFKTNKLSEWLQELSYKNYIVKYRDIEFLVTYYHTCGRDKVEVSIDYYRR